MPTATSTRPWKACPITTTTTLTFTERGFTTLRRGERIAPRVLAPGRVTLLRSQAGPLAGDHDRVEIVVESGTLTVEPVAASVALPGPEPTRLELDVTVGAGAHLRLEDAPLVVAEGADVTRTTTIRLGPGATASIVDVVILGRAGEGPGRLRSLLRADGPDGVILHDALDVDPRTWAEDAYVALPPGHRVLATIARLGEPGNLHGQGDLQRRSAVTAADLGVSSATWTS